MFVVVVVVVVRIRVHGIARVKKKNLGGTTTGGITREFRYRDYYTPFDRSVVVVRDAFSDQFYSVLGGIRCHIQYMCVRI